MRAHTRCTTQTLMTVICMVLLGLGAVPALAQSSADAISDFLVETRGAASVRTNPATGVAKFVRLQPGALSDLPGAAVEARADAFFSRYGRMFGIDDPGQLQRFAVVRSPAMAHVKYQQFHRGVPVFAGVLHASFDRGNRLVAINGVFLPDLAVDTNPSWSAEAAADVALRRVSAAELAANTTLYVFRSGLLQGIPGRNHLVWEVEVVNAARSVREFVYVDAHYGKVVDQITGIREALNRDVSETSLGNVVWTEGDPNPIPAGWSGGSAQDIIDWQDEIDGAEETYNLFGSMTNGAYLSYDGAMAQMRTVNNDPNINCPNARWTGVSANYCTGVTADDVVAHEWGHAYTEYTNNLIYQWQSGALNESYSDIYGETVDQLNGRGTDTPANPRSAGGCSIYNNGAPDNSYLWLMGEDASAFGTAIRDMWHPNCENDPGKVTDSGQYDCNLEPDGGGVHTNSGVPNHAYALLVDGGTYNGFTVSALGFTKAARIEWEAQNLLGPASDFVDNADALDTACAALIGATLYELDTSSPTGVVSGQSITVGDCAEVADASAAVELRTPPTFCNFSPLLDPNAPALCGGGPVDDIHFQDWEGGLGTWTVGTRAVASPSTFDTPDWAVVGDLPDNQPGSAAFVEDGQRGDCNTDIEAGILYLQSPVINVPAGASPQLAFDHWVATEASWDGGNVKASVNGGSFNVVASGAFDFNSYNDTLVTFSPQFGSSDNPMAGESAFTGTDGGSVGGSWGQSQVDLSGIAGPGDNVQLRFEMGLDGCNGIIGWYVDNARVYSCGVDPCGDGFCAGSGAGEDCSTCPVDCPSFPIGGADPNNGICEAGDGETCYTTSDCNGTTNGKPSNRFCCGLDANESTPYAPDGCDSRCDTGGNTCTTVPVGGGGSTCCGDGVCESPEDSANCEIDCPDLCGNNTIDPPETCDGTDLGGETCISQGCTGGTLACDASCSAFDTSSCTGCECTLAQEGESCRNDEDCCSNNCSGGKPSTRVCLP